MDFSHCIFYWKTHACISCSLSYFQGPIVLRQRQTGIKGNTFQFLQSVAVVSLHKAWSDLMLMEHICEENPAFNLIMFLLALWLSVVQSFHWEHNSLKDRTEEDSFADAFGISGAYVARVFSHYPQLLLNVLSCLLSFPSGEPNCRVIFKYKERVNK